MSAGSKKKLRQEILQKVDTLSFNDLIQKSQEFKDVFEKNFYHPFHTELKKKYIVSFCPFETEPQLSLEMYDLNIGYVRVLDWAQGTMDAAEARRDLPGQWIDFSPQENLLIYQPSESQTPLKAEQIGAILVPALAFDAEGRRLGRGKGFYDRFLKQIPDALRVGVIFHEQVLDQKTMQAHEDPWDERVDAILTDRQWLETERFNLWKNHGTVKR